MATVTLAAICGCTPAGAAWQRHAVEAGGGGMVGADGTRLGDVDGDGLMDVVTGWEQSGEVRVYRNPGPERVESPWPAVTVGRARGVEDACFVDFDRDGVLDVISCAEGKTRRVFLHRAPGGVGDYFDPSAWATEEIAGGQAWMFAWVAGDEVFLGSKGEEAGVFRGLLGNGDGRIGLERLVDAGWVMTLEMVEFGGEVGRRLVVTDRKGGRRGVWLWGAGSGAGLIGGGGREVMFADAGDLDGDGEVELVVATRDGVWLVLDRVGGRWGETVYPNPLGTRCGKAVAIGDVDQEGENDVVMSFNTQGELEKPGVVWLKRSGEAWSETDISGPEGNKFDLVELLDLDGDGDLDVLTCEESDNLGVIWYENPSR